MVKKENLILMVAVVMVVLIGTGSAWAFSGSGSGTEADPYVITDANQLQETQDDLGAHYVLGNDIDATGTQSWNGGEGFVPIGLDADPFTGSFDGQRHTITNLYINRPSMDFVGLFGCVRNGAKIQNVGLSEVDITARRNSGPLVGLSNGATVCNSWSTGNVRGSYDYQMRLGGLLGISSGANSYVYQCFSSANVTATGGAHQVGGLSGYNGHGSIMSDCYATGNVSGYLKVGGLVGDNPYPEGGYITRCYSTGKVSGNGGGLVGFNYLGGKTYDSYWDIQTSGKSSSYGGTGKTTAEMMQQSTFVGWDFDEIWDIDEGQSYPYFQEPRVLVGLEMVGPDKVAEDLQTQYSAIAVYDNNSTKDVTDLADWSVEPNDIASITAGLLKTEVIDLPMDITITAQYSEGDVNETAEKQVSILAICPSGSALEFDGVDDYVSVATDDSLDFTRSFSVSTWVNPESKDQHIFSYYERASTRKAIHIKIHSNGKVRFAFYSDDLTTDQQALSFNVWNNVVCTYDHISDTSKIYINGVLAKTGNNGPYEGSHAYSWIGKSWTSEQGFDGMIDEVAIFNRALSAEEIQAIMYTRPDTNEPNMVAYWDFDEGQGQIAYDMSVNGNNGTLGSTPGIDSSDPNWVDSDAPVGICSVEGIVERNLLNVLGLKNEVLDILDEVIGKEEALWEYMDIVFKDRDFGDASKGDVVKAKQKIHSAIQQEEQAENAVDESVDRLDEALDTLGIEQNVE